MARQSRPSRKVKAGGRDPSQFGNVLFMEPVQTNKPRRPASTKPLVPLNDAQRAYDVAIKASRLTFGIGSAGTGKTWWAAARAAEALMDRKIDKIYITRPIVEAGEKLGFLPGDLNEKVEPYLAPVREAIEERLGQGHFEYLLRKKIIDVRPLAYMRGATFKNCWVLADEMQNASKVQMKLILSRIGEGSKFIINGDTSQIDISEHMSGLEDAVYRLQGIDGVSVVRFVASDIVRDPMCRAIIEAYEN